MTTHTDQHLRTRSYFSVTPSRYMDCLKGRTPSGSTPLSLRGGPYRLERVMVRETGDRSCVCGGYSVPMRSPSDAEIGWQQGDTPRREKNFRVCSRNFLVVSVLENRGFMNNASISDSGDNIVRRTALLPSSGREVCRFALRQIPLLELVSTSSAFSPSPLLDPAIGRCTGVSNRGIQLGPTFASLLGSAG